MDDSFDFLDEDFIINEVKNVDLSALKYNPKTAIKIEAKTALKPEEKTALKPAIKEKVMKAVKPSKSQPEKLSDEDIINKRRQILMIQFYINEFPDKLQQFKKMKFEKKTIEELNDLKKEIDFIISNKSNVRSGIQIITTGIQTLEFILLNFTPVNAKGLSNICNDKETLDDIKHLALKHCHLISSEPESRLMYKIVTTTLLLHNINSNIDINNPNIDKINIDFDDI